MHLLVCVKDYIRRKEEKRSKNGNFVNALPILDIPEHRKGQKDRKRGGEGGR